MSITEKQFRDRAMNFEEYLNSLDLFIRSFYFENEALLELMMCLYQLPFA